MLFTTEQPVSKAFEATGIVKRKDFVSSGFQIIIEGYSMAAGFSKSTSPTQQKKCAS